MSARKIEDDPGIDMFGMLGIERMVNTSLGEGFEDNLGRGHIDIQGQKDGPIVRAAGNCEEGLVEPVSSAGDAAGKAEIQKTVLEEQSIVDE